MNAVGKNAEAGPGLPGRGPEREREQKPHRPKPPHAFLVHFGQLRGRRAFPRCQEVIGVAVAHRAAPRTPPLVHRPCCWTAAALTPHKLPCVHSLVGHLPSWKPLRLCHPADLPAETDCTAGKYPLATCMAGRAPTQLDTLAPAPCGGTWCTGTTVGPGDAGQPGVGGWAGDARGRRRSGLGLRNQRLASLPQHVLACARQALRGSVVLRLRHGITREPRYTPGDTPGWPPHSVTAATCGSGRHGSRSSPNRLSRAPSVAFTSLSSFQDWPSTSAADGCPLLAVGAVTTDAAAAPPAAAPLPRPPPISAGGPRSPLTLPPLPGRPAAAAPPGAEPGSCFAAATAPPPAAAARLAASSVCVYCSCHSPWPCMPPPPAARDSTSCSGSWPRIWPTSWSYTAPPTADTSAP